VAAVIIFCRISCSVLLNNATFQILIITGNTDIVCVFIYIQCELILWKDVSMM